MFQIDKFGRTPIYEQIVHQTEELVAAGALRPGERLPSVRALSRSSGVNPNTLQRAYAELERKGVCKSAPGSGRFIAEDAPKTVLEQKKGRLKELSLLAKDLARGGVTESEVIEAVRAAYGKKEESK